MPILAAEPDIFPVSLLETPPDLPWWVVYTRSRQEKQLVRKLRAAGVNHYCPCIQRRTRGAHGRTLTSYVPLFPNYVFLNGTHDARLAALKTNHVSRILDVLRPNELIHDLFQIRGLILSGEPISPEAKLEAGSRVRVKSGPFKAYEGIVIQRQGKTRLIVDVRFMNQGASVEIEDYLLEPI